MKPHAIKIVAPIIFLIGTMLANAQEMNCEELVRYRNTEVISKYINKKKTFKIKIEHINIIKALKQSIIDDNSFATSGYMTSILLVETLNDLTQSAIDLIFFLNPKSIKNIPKNAKLLIKITEVIKDAIGFEKSNNDTESVARKIARDLSKIASKFFNLQENLENFKQQDNLKREIILILTDIEKEITNHNNKLSDINTSKDELKNYLEYIDNYLKENCKSEVENNPIDIESTLWNTNDENSINSDTSTFNYDISALMNNPELSQYYNFNDDFTKELMALMNNLDYTSEASMNNYMKQIENLLQKYLKNSNIDFDINDKSKTFIVKPKRKSLIPQKRARVFNNTSYSSFIKQSKNGQNNSKPYTKVKVRTNSSSLKKAESCNHSATWHKAYGTCASKQ